MNKKSIILLSGGLDSLVALGIAKDKYNITLAITFDYGQKSVIQEKSSSKKLAKYYNVEHEIIKLPFLKNITKSVLVNEKDVPEENLYTKDSVKQVWVPNRNALFLNIAASYADSYGFTHIVFGANKEESLVFPDNTKKFIDSMTTVFKTSTFAHPKVVAPLINFNKNDIVRLALENNLPLELTRSCYNSSKKNCGKCESCKRLKKALKANNDTKYIKVLFEDVN